MADTREAIALRLHKFIEEAERAADAHIPQMLRVEPRRPSEVKKPILEVYEQCLRMLNPEDLAALDRILGTMSGAVDDSRRAIPPIPPP